MNYGRKRAHLPVGCESQPNNDNDTCDREEYTNELYLKYGDGDA